ncbi:lipid kinase [Parenemella sanctibonifatiensis]|uniref:Lipid kinase n=1 Tax=Parenemella sanctibonifatiensis TaxID=2016505 RepID=A0A255EPG0_9ACTN|nr:lipid kinase [Parenemella sanctibonifatiensis]
MNPVATPQDTPVLTLVTNPRAGVGRGAKILPEVVAHLVRGLPDWRIHLMETVSYPEAERALADAVASSRPATDQRPADALAVLGGDGMMHLGLNACAATGVPLGMIPGGTGNDLCRGLGIDAHDTQAAVRAIIAGRTREVDLLSTSGSLVGGPTRWVGSAVATGYPAKVNRRANALSWPRGGARYFVAAMAELRTFEPMQYHLEIDGEQRSFEAMFVVVGNTKYFGSGMHACPYAEPDDGLADVTIVHPTDKATLVRLLPRMYSGRYVAHPAVELLRASRVRLAGSDLYCMADGEDLGPTPVDIQIRPGALEVYVP